MDITGRYGSTYVYYRQKTHNSHLSLRTKAVLGEKKSYVEWQVKYSLFVCMNGDVTDMFPYVKLPLLSCKL